MDETEILIKRQSLIDLFFFIAFDNSLSKFKTSSSSSRLPAERTPSVCITGHQTTPPTIASIRRTSTSLLSTSLAAQKEQPLSGRNARISKLRIRGVYLSRTYAMCRGGRSEACAGLVLPRWSIHHFASYVISVPPFSADPIEIASTDGGPKATSRTDGREHGNPTRATGGVEANDLILTDDSQQRYCTLSVITGNLTSLPQNDSLFRNHSSPFIQRLGRSLDLAKKNIEKKEEHEVLIKYIPYSLL
jgi:hypothetical protein